MAVHFRRARFVFYPPRPPCRHTRAAGEGRALVQQGDAARKIPGVQCHGAAMTGWRRPFPVCWACCVITSTASRRWKTGQRKAQSPDCMADVARQLTPEDVSAVSAWLAAQLVPGNGKPVASLRAAMPARCGGVAEGGRPANPQRFLRLVSGAMARPGHQRAAIVTLNLRGDTPCPAQKPWAHPALVAQGEYLTRVQLLARHMAQGGAPLRAGAALKRQVWRGLQLQLTPDKSHRPGRVDVGRVLARHAQRPWQRRAAAVPRLSVHQLHPRHA